jgi:hypothetical protein
MLPISLARECGEFKFAAIDLQICDSPGSVLSDKERSVVFPASFSIGLADFAHEIEHQSGFASNKFDFRVAWRRFVLVLHLVTSFFGAA